MRRNIMAKQQGGWSLPTSGGLANSSSGEFRKERGAQDLWEDWEHALPFTVGENFLNVGLTHEVAFAAHNFGGIRRLPSRFDSYGELARKVEHKYVRGWLAKDGNRMFLWDDFDEMLGSPRSHYAYFEVAVRKLRRRGCARPSTELWDRGGERYVGTLGGLSLLVS